MQHCGVSHLWSFCSDVVFAVAVVVDGGSGGGGGVGIIALEVHVEFIIAGHREVGKTAIKVGNVQSELEAETMRRVVKDFQLTLDKVAEDVAREDFALKLRP